MKMVLIEVRVAALEAARQFYCEELALFDFCQDFGMRSLSLAYRANESILLLLSEGTPTIVDRPLFSLEVDSCEALFNRLRVQPFKSGAKLLSEEIFEYPLEKSLALQDPSGHRFILFESLNVSVG